MKILLTILLGALIGYVNSQWDVRGQLALVQHQMELNHAGTFKAATSETLEVPSFKFRLFGF
ncbi:hypothetical protein [Rufibacter sp. LB8]|uniref:hypothetical protein n=1 Tax=Rufibacter sp. LB8 TaxID=2777781 RepID=UPI00178C4952|nr:hypothetical protein [Rufibacter sp. LB8]